LEALAVKKGLACEQIIEVREANRNSSHLNNESCLIEALCAELMFETHVWLFDCCVP